MVEWRVSRLQHLMWTLCSMDALRYDARQLLALSSISGRVESDLVGDKGGAAAPAYDQFASRYEARLRLALASTDGRVEKCLGLRL